MSESERQEQELGRCKILDLNESIDPNKSENFFEIKNTLEDTCIIEKTDHSVN